MPVITLKTIARAGMLLDTIASRLEQTGMRSTTLAELITRWDAFAGSIDELPTPVTAMDPDNPQVQIAPAFKGPDGLKSIPAPELAQLQVLAAKLEQVAYAKRVTYVIQPYLAQLRYLLAEEVR